MKKYKKRKKYIYTWYMYKNITKRKGMPTGGKRYPGRLNTETRREDKTKPIRVKMVTNQAVSNKADGSKRPASGAATAMCFECAYCCCIRRNGNKPGSQQQSRWQQATSVGGSNRDVLRMRLLLLHDGQERCRMWSCRLFTAVSLTTVVTIPPSSPPYSIRKRTQKLSKQRTK